MPRQSAASLTVAPTGVAHLPTRPEPPERLPEAAAAVWRRVTASRDSSYFDAGSLPVLEVYCRSTAEHRRVLALVEQMDPVAQVDAFAKLSRIADMHAARASQAATRLRLTHQSRTDSRGAGRAAGRAPAGTADAIRAAYRGGSHEG
jgi:hypothetical protein